MNDAYLITGATGFVGANLVRKLVSEKKNVHILTRKKHLNWRLNDISSKIKFYETDLRSSDIPTIVSRIKPAFIFHLAAYGSLPNEEKMDEIIDVNLRGTINLIKAFKGQKFKRFINTGSSSEYGVKYEKMRETDLPFPVNDYGVIKTAITLFAHKEALRNSQPIITFRLFSNYGPYEEKTRLIPSVILSALKNESIKVGNKNHVRDFIYVEDVADAYIHSCEVKVEPGEIFNIGTGSQFTVEDVVKKVLKLTGSKSKVDWGVIPVQQRQIEEGKWQADITKTKKLLRWEAKYNFTHGLEQSINWFKKNQDHYE